MQPLGAQATDPERRYRTLTIIGRVILMNVFLLYALANLVGPERSQLPENRPLTFMLTAAGLFTVAISYFVRRMLLARAIEQQSGQALSSAYIVSFALCEAAALFGFLLRFMTNQHIYSTLLFAIGAIGVWLNQPRRDDVLNALTVKRV